MRKWFHHLFNPHCADCKFNQLESKECKSCDTLKLALDHLEYQNRELLKTILELSKPKVETVPTLTREEIESLAPKTIPWHVKRRQLEAEDRETARIMKEKEKEIEDSKKDFTVKVSPDIVKLEEEILEGANHA